MKTLLFKYTTTIEERYIDMICAKRSYQQMIDDGTGALIPNPEDKFTFVTRLFCNLIDTCVVQKEFLDLSEAGIRAQSNQLLNQAINRIDAKIQEVRTIETEIL